MFAKPLAFFRRDLGVAVTYRLQFVHGLAMLGLSMISLNFMSRLMNEGAPATLATYGNDYFAFALVGLSIALFAQAVAGQFPAAVRGAQVTGTLEVITASRTSLPVFLGCSALYGSVEALIRLAFMLAVGAVLLNAALRLESAGMVIAVIILTTAIFAGIGILAAAFTARFNQSEPFTGAFISASFLLSGVFYPTSVLPGWLEALSPLLPLTHAIEALRSVLLATTPVASSAEHVLALAGFAMLLPLSLLVFAMVIRQARAEGTISHH